MLFVVHLFCSFKMSDPLILSQVFSHIWKCAQAMAVFSWNIYIYAKLHNVYCCRCLMIVELMERYISYIFTSCNCSPFHKTITILSITVFQVLEKIHTIAINIELCVAKWEKWIQCIWYVKIGVRRQCHAHDIKGLRGVIMFTSD